MMKKQVLLYVWALCATGLAFSLYANLPQIVSAATTTSTTTVIGWLVPDGTHWNNGIGSLLFPLVGVGLFAGVGRLLELKGDFGVTLILAGFTVGGLVSMLSLNASSNNVLPFALVIVPGVDFILWVWKGGG